MKNDRIDEPYFRGRRTGTLSVSKRHFAGDETYFRQQSLIGELQRQNWPLGLTASIPTLLAAEALAKKLTRE